MSQEMEKNLAALKDMSAADLRRAYVKLTGRPAPSRFRAPLLRQVLAYELQYRSLTAPARREHERRLKAAVAAASNGKSGNGSPPPRPRYGSRLVRDWNGRTHVVEVTEQGFVYEGRTYRSLSAIATEITRTRRNGPNFFGLRKGSGS